MTIEELVQIHSPVTLYHLTDAEGSHRGYGLYFELEGRVAEGPTVQACVDKVAARFEQEHQKAA